MGRTSRWLRRHGIMIAAVTVAGMVAAGAVIRQRRATDDILREAEAALGAHQYTKAREQLTRYLEARPHDARARLLAARTARGLREYYEAAEHLKRCREDGGDVEAVEVEQTLAEIQRGRAGPDDALRRRAERDDELALVVLEVLIQFDLDTYQLHRARDELTRYLKARPDDLHARLGRGYVWERFLYFADAVEDYRHAVARHPDSEVARLKLAGALLVVGTPAEALGHYEYVAEHRPERPEVRLGLARCYRRLGRAEEAARVLGPLLDQAPAHGEALLERGQLELDRGRPAAAEKWLRRSFDTMPRDRRVNYALYRCLLALANAEAQSFNDRVAQIDADMRRLDQLRFAVMDRPDDAGLRCEGGLLFLRNGEREEGIHWLELALRLDPNCEKARAALTKARRGPRADAIDGGTELK